MAQLTVKYGVHQTMISAWKKQAIDGMSGVFSRKAEAAEDAREGEVEKLHAMIGQLVVERDFLKRAFGRVTRRPEARNDRTRTPQAHDPTAV